MMIINDFELLEAGPVHLRFALPNGSFKREVKTPDDDITDLPGEVQTAITGHWTPKRISDWRAHRQAIEDELQASLPPSEPLNDYKAAFDAHLDAVAQSRQYDNRVSIATYAGSANPQWASEAQAFIAWRDLALGSMFEQLADVQAGGEIPTVEEFVAELPEIVWP
jgi:hypothetical protein